MGFLAEVNAQLHPVPFPNYDYSGKTIIVTGANSGIGKEAVKHFVRLNAARVIGTARSTEKCKETLAEVKASTEKQSVVEFWELEYASYTSVLSFCSKASELQRVDNIILNAGINTKLYEVFEQNESNITVNVISTLLLTALLIPVLQKSADKFHSTNMLTITGSKIYTWAKFPERTASNIFEALNESRDTMNERYPTSKLLQLFAFLEIANRSPASYPSVIVNMVSPGLVATNLGRTSTGVEKLIIKLISKVAWTPEQGGRTLIEATARGRSSHGVLLSEGRLKTPDVLPWIKGEEGARIQQQVWLELSTKLNAIYPAALNGY